MNRPSDRPPEPAAVIDGQLDLIEELEKHEEPAGYQARVLTDTERIAYGLATIHYAASWLYDLVGTLEHKGGPDESRKPCAVRGAFAYAIGRHGLWFEPFDQWADRDGGRRDPWETRPAYLLGWGEIRDLIGSRPEREEFNEWAETIPHPESMWRYSRPWELHANRTRLTEEQLAAGWKYAQEPTDPETIDQWRRMLAMFPRIIAEAGGSSIALPTGTGDVYA